MRGHVHFDPPRQPVLRRHRRDHRVDLLGRPGDHRLARRGIHRHRHLGILGDQRLGGLGIQLQQRHRALAGQPRHQPRPRRDHPQPLGRAQRPGHHRGGHLAHRMPDHRIRFHPVGAPQRRQRQLHTHQHRLHPLDTHHRLTVDQAPRCSENPTCSTKSAPTRPPPPRTPAHRPATAGPCPPTANPDPSTRTPARPAAPHAGHHPRRRPPAANARNPATAWARSRAHTVANLGCRAAVMVERCGRHQPTAPAAPAPAIQSANTAAVDAIRVGASCPTPPASSHRSRRGVGTRHRMPAPARSPRAHSSRRRRTTTPRPGADPPSAGHGLRSRWERTAGSATRRSPDSTA